VTKYRIRPYFLTISFREDTLDPGTPTDVPHLTTVWHRAKIPRGFVPETCQNRTAKVVTAPVLARAKVLRHSWCWRIICPVKTLHLLLPPAEDLGEGALLLLRLFLSFTLQVFKSRKESIYLLPLILPKPLRTMLLEPLIPRVIARCMLCINAHHSSSLPPIPPPSHPLSLAIEACVMCRCPCRCYCPSSLPISLLSFSLHYIFCECERAMS
jgi:hypothetical protein